MSAYHMRISAWRSDVCSSDLCSERRVDTSAQLRIRQALRPAQPAGPWRLNLEQWRQPGPGARRRSHPRFPAACLRRPDDGQSSQGLGQTLLPGCSLTSDKPSRKTVFAARHTARSEEHTSELQSLMRNSYAVFCLQKKKTNNRNTQL